MKSPLILLPGMGASADVFAPQAAEFPNLVVPDWIPPQPEETLPRYAERMAHIVDPCGPCVVGGISFGGMVAVEMRRHLDARACLLIATVRSPAHLPRRLTLLRPAIASLALTAGLTRPLARAIATAGKHVLHPATVEFLQESADADPAFLRWSAHAIMSWKLEDAAATCPTYHIHGGSDWILPARCVHPDVAIPGGGHLLTLTHPKEVNRFLREHLI
ncbi:MAG: alpha/beta hydrolase [Planctomycetota bacterium]